MVEGPTHSQFHEISGDSRPAARSSRAAACSERSTLERVISDLQRSGAAALTPRLQAARGGWLVECQALCS